MASSDIITEVEIQPDIQEVEIETIPVEIPCETVETTIEGEDAQPMIALQPLPEPGREEIILQTQEEIVGADPLNVYDQIPVPEADIYVESSPGPSRKATKKARKSGGTRFRASDHIFTEMAPETKARKWEQKQVQIKTLEGEFSVTMWASGTDDGEYERRAAFVILSFQPVLAPLVHLPQRAILSLRPLCIHAHGRVRTSGAMLRSILRWVPRARDCSAENCSPSRASFACPPA